MGTGAAYTPGLDVSRLAGAVIALMSPGDKVLNPAVRHQPDQRHDREDSDPEKGLKRGDGDADSIDHGGRFAFPVTAESPGQGPVPALGGDQPTFQDVVRDRSTQQVDSIKQDGDLNEAGLIH